MRKFGLIGYPLGHSFSKKYFTDKFLRANIEDCVYSNFEIASLDELQEILKDPELRGLNVTIPHKESVIPFLHIKHPVVEEISACNCIKIVKGQLSGYNTDVVGFESSLTEKLSAKDSRALILGTGGSSKAVAWVLKKKGIKFLFVSRSLSTEIDHINYKDLNQEIVESHSLIINTTPLGMEPKTSDCPPIPYQWISQNHYLFDLIYNPMLTLFLEKGREAGTRFKNGSDMLARQAEASWEIWNS